MKKALLIIAPGNFRDEELFETQKVLETVGIKTAIAASEKGEFVGMLGGKAKAAHTLFDINIADWDAIIFVGGVGAQTYFTDALALAIAEEAVRQNKVVGAICIAPSILANAGVLEGKRATAYPSQKVNLTQKGAIWDPGPVVVDGQIVTANGPQVADKFAWEIAKLLKPKALAQPG